ncbi:MAG: hypothetical protein AAGA83_05020 [Cyanobacteria bacterium P01_F01_bin.116]
MVVTTHLINQSPGAELVGGVTLYFEPTTTPSIELITTPNIDCSYRNAVAQGIHNSLPEDITGLRIWWCNWLWHPVDSRPKAFTRAAEIATTAILPWLSRKDFLEDAAPQETKISPPFPSNIFEHCPVRPTGIPHLYPPTTACWTVKTPLISHITRLQGAHLLSTNTNTPHRLIGSSIVTETTLSFKSIASTQRVCPVDKLPEFHREHREIFNTFADTIRSQLPNARGFDIMVQQLNHHSNSSHSKQQKSPKFYQARCLAILTAALQQAINVRGCR